MANSLMQLVSDGNLSAVPLTIKFFEQSHISVYIDDVALPAAGYSYVWSGATTITITPTVAFGVEVSIRRRTPADYVLHDFQAGAVFSELSVDENFRQDLFLLQEASEQSFVTDLYSDLDMHRNKVRNLGAAMLGGDATPLSQVQQIVSASGGNPFVSGQLLESQRRSYANAGYNVVGTFQAGFTYVNATDVGIDEATGKGFTGPAGEVAAGTAPSSGAFIDVSSQLALTFDNVPSMLGYRGFVVGQRVFWLGWHGISDGGGSWGVVKLGAHTEDGGSIFSISPSLYIEANTTGKRITLKKFGCIQDGVTVDTVQFYKAVDFAINNNLILDGKGYPLLISDSNIKTLTSTTSVKLHNLTIVPGLTYTDQPRLIFPSDVEYELVNIKVKGGRGTKVGLEPWKKFSAFGGYDSITPSTGNMIIIGGGLIQSNITVSGFDARNCHYESLITAFTRGTITAEKFYFENCSNKQFHFWHGIDGGAQPLTGVTNLNGYVARNCGILPVSFTVDGVTKSRADAVAPQGAFGCIVTYGTFNHSNIFVYNYGATGVTPDRNISAMGTKVKIWHNDPAAFNNNPSGAYWDELCGNCTVDGLEIRITARDPRETPLESSALQVFKGSSDTFSATNVVIETAGSAGTNKDIRAALGNGAQLSINGYSLESNGIHSIAVLQYAGLSAKVELKSGRVRGAPMRITQSGSVVIEGLDSDQNLTIDQSLPSPIGGVSIAASKCNNLNINGSNGLINIDGGSIASFNVSGITGARVHLDGGLEIRGVAFLTALKSLTVGDIETVRRLEVQNVERVKMCGSVLKTDAPESCLAFSPTAPGIMKHVSLIGVSRWVKTGTVGAGYIVTNANTPAISDISPDNKTFDWT